ncbi:MAG: peptidoglycan DD-metalloendopeptidase family protein [Bacteroidota bacterium]
MQVQLQSPVGLNTVNREDDVRALQAGLKEAARLTLDDRLGPGLIDGLYGPGTAGAIATMQRRIGMRRPDGRVDPGGSTLGRLNALLAIDKVVLTFPFASHPEDRFPFRGIDAGPRRFGARRSGGQRAHAGIDLYQPDFTPVLAIAGGTVIGTPSYFYNQTYAVVIDHGPFIAWYGEIAPEDDWFVRDGDQVTAGQQVGRVGILKHSNGHRMNLPSMMLHFEMYDKTQPATHGLTQRTRSRSALSEHGVPFYRRKDLIDPTGFIHRATLPSPPA